MLFQILASGSSGNAALLKTASATILVDGGLSARKLDQLLSAVGFSLADIDALFLSHEHGDHAACVEGLGRFPTIRVFANQSTAHAIQDRVKRSVKWNYFETGNAFEFADLNVSTFAVPHDASDPVGFYFEDRAGASVSYLTDLGHVPDQAFKFACQAEILVLEANHCPELLESDTRRPWATKQRIKGRHGHLSNIAVRELINGAGNVRWKHVFFTHLSSDCNSVDAVERTCGSALVSRGCRFTVVPAGGSAASISV